MKSGEVCVETNDVDEEYRMLLNSGTHTIEYLGLFHLRFEVAHPFIDGNGRTGRLLLNLDLTQNGYPPINIKFTDIRYYYEKIGDLGAKDRLKRVSEMTWQIYAV